MRVGAIGSGLLSCWLAVMHIAHAFKLVCIIIIVTFQNITRSLSMDKQT